jgi:hypothetical protein
MDVVEMRFWTLGPGWHNRPSWRLSWHLKSKLASKSHSKAKRKFHLLVVACACLAFLIKSISYRIVMMKTGPSNSACFLVLAWRSK